MAGDPKKTPVSAASEKKDGPSKADKDKTATKDIEGLKSGLEDLSEEDQLLKDELDEAVVKVQNQDAGVQQKAIASMCDKIRNATASMTAVPKPLKFLRPHYDTLIDFYEKMSTGHSNKKALADIASVLAMTMSKEGSRLSLKYKLQGNYEELAPWGHEYIRSLAGEISEEYSERVSSMENVEKDPNTSDLMKLVDIIVPFNMQHNSEPEAIDLLMEVQSLEKLKESPDVDEKNCKRVCDYLLGCASFMADPDDLLTLLKVTMHLYLRMKLYPGALRVSLMIDDTDVISKIFDQCEDDSVKKQLAYMLGRHRVNFEYEEDEDINEIISNTQLSEQFLALARELDVMDAKSPEDIYKSHLSETNSMRNRRTTDGQQVDSARQNLASTFVNSFVNAGFGHDNLMTPEGAKWLYKNKEHGMTSAAASLGMILQWNVEEGLTQIDKFLYSSEEYIKAGAVLAVGIVSNGVRNECDPALALLSEHVQGSSKVMRSTAAAGLGLAYAGSSREDVLEILSPMVSDTGDKVEMQEVCLAALSLGLLYVGSCDEDVGSILMQRLMESSEAELDQSVSRFLCLGLGLLFLGKQERADAMMEVVKTITHPIGKYAEITLESCAYAGTGNVLQVQKMLHVCAENLYKTDEKEKKDEEKEEEKEEEKKELDLSKSGFQSVAVIGIALICVGENISTQMAIRTYDHLLQYGEKPIRMAIPLALSLLFVSNPDFAVIDTLSRLTHDTDADVACAAIMSLGIISAGTNNSRVAGLLRQLSEFYSREQNQLFMVRIAQGLLHAGKGLMTFNPFHQDRLLLSHVSLGGILTIMHAGLDLKNTILDKLHYMLFYLVCAMQPRMLITLDQDMKPLPVSVRVGQAIETVGQAGNPRTITGFQTHTTPVLLGVSDRAELATEEYIALTDVLEGFVILKPNPEYVKE